MPLLDAFCGGAYQALSATFAADMQVNLYLETRRIEGSQKTRVLYGTPGRVAVVSGSSGFCRGSFTQDSLSLTVIGSTLYQFTAAAGSLTSLGSISNDGFPVSFASNGTGGDQVAIVGGNELKILDTATMTLSAAIVLPFSGPVMVAFIDGYFLINQRNSPIVWFSNLEDGTTWDALDFFTRSGTSDNIVAIGVATSRVWCFGSQTTTLFYDSGDADTPFVPYPESTRQIGLVNAYALSAKTDIFTWLATDQTGRVYVNRASGDPTGQAVSTPPIEEFLARCTTLETARSLSYSDTGHIFWALSCPDTEDDVKCYVWDDVERQWHARADWDPVLGRFTDWTAREVIQIDNTIYIGDAVEPTIYRLEQTAYDDDGGILKAVRRVPYLSAENQWLFLDQIELGAEVGVGLVTGQGDDPVVELRLSRDAGQTWISAGFASLGRLGEYVTRVIWRRLGRVRGDRLVLEIGMTDPVKRAFLGLWVRPQTGTGQL